jgi:Flp pilus assembly protein TadG
MKLGWFYRDSNGGAAIEFGITAPLFFMLVVGIMEFGLLMWTQAGLQHGSAMAARCAAVNATLCGSTSQIQTYAAQQTMGLNPPASTFAVSTPTCGKQVSASYSFNFVTSYFGLPSMAINAQSCFPT